MSAPGMRAPGMRRRVERLVRGQATSDGDGVKLTRVLTQDLQRRLDPFLMLDNFASDNPDDYIGGFPNHPHRGFETVTYMIAGRMRHRDSAGHEGLLQSGGVQWMTAGFGLIHSELPEQEAGLMEGFQLWLNLPAKDKLCAPSYRDIPAEQIPSYEAPGVQVRVIAGSTHGVEGAVLRDATTHPTQCLMLDVALNAGHTFTHALPASHNALVFVYRGSLQVGGEDAQSVPLKHMAILDNQGSEVRLRATEDARALLIAGAPLKEPIAQYGTFVMNTREELMTAVDDFRNGKMG